jgi:hydrogenase nickel incorporation protein HypA/HybF
MHEMAVTQEILKIALEKARENQASEIQAVNLVIGDLTSFIDDSVQFYFTILSKNTPAEKAVLHINRITAEMRCRECQMIFTPTAQPWQCPQCHSLDFEIIRGQELYIDSIEIP